MAPGAREVAQVLAGVLPIGLFARVLPREVIGLCYHVVSDESLAHVRHISGYKSASQFEADLLFLKRHFRFAHYDDLIAARSGGRSLPRNSVLLTFDDGFAECFTVVRPLLLKHGIPAIFFLTTRALDNRTLLHPNKVSLCIDVLERCGDSGVAAVDELVREETGVGTSDRRMLLEWVRGFARTGHPERAHEVLDRLCDALGLDVPRYLADRRPYLTEEEARRLASDGFTLGGHSLSHPHLGSVTDRGRIEEEIVRSCEMVADLGGPRPVPFAFPHDADGLDRGLLEGILARHSLLGPTFGTGRMRLERQIVNRLSVDRPAGARPAGTNLPRYLRGAYLGALRDALGGKARYARRASMSRSRWNAAEDE